MLNRNKLAFLLAFLILPLAPPASAALIDRVNEAYRAVHGINPSGSEWTYWAGRVSGGEKKSFESLVGAISYQKVHGRRPVPLAVAGTSAPAAGSYKTSASLYPSPHSPNLLPDGTLISPTNNPGVYYVKGGKKSYVLPSILDRWLKEAHFFNPGVIVNISLQDFARYSNTSAPNPLYIGKVLVHPNGQQYYIDDKLRKRPLSAAVRARLKFPGGNKYDATGALLQQFPSGPALIGDKQPGGMILYDGPYHGGRIWRIQEATGGILQKRLYLGDYFYEAEYYPDENQRVAASAADLAKYQRGSNISAYPDGWLVKINNAVYLMQQGKRRHITSPKVLAALGYGPQNIISAFANFTSKNPEGQPVSAFKTINESSTSIKASPGSAPAGNTGHLIRVRPSVRALIGNINPLYRRVFDKEIISAENTFWADYIFSGEVSTEAELIDKMQQTKSTGQKPGRTSRTANISLDELKGKWFPYLFYYLHQKEPSAADTAYWHSRITEGDRDTIQKLDGNIQWLWQNERKTSK